MTVQTITIPVDPTAEVTVTATDGKLKVLQGIVGGYIEAVGGDDYSIFLDEEGKLKNKPVNERATALAHRLGAIHVLDVIVGDVVVLGLDPETGSNADAPGWVLTHLADARI